MIDRAASTWKNRFKSIKEIFAELKKVVWLSRKEAAYLTILVIVVTALFGLFLGLIDFGFSELFGWILGR